MIFIYHKCTVVTVVYRLAVPLYVSLHAGSCTFSSQPTNTLVYPGNSTFFGCDCIEESHPTPFWYINQRYYTFTSLPSSFSYNPHLSALEIAKVTISMNLTTIQCFVGELSSTVGILYVLEELSDQNIPRTTNLLSFVQASRTESLHINQSSTIFQTCTGENQ